MLLGQASAAAGGAGGCPATCRRRHSSCSSSSRRQVSCSAAGSQHTSVRAAEQTSRRALLAGVASLPIGLAVTAAPGPAAAENAYTTWWKSRRTANGGAKLLNPLYVARGRLQEAHDLLAASSPPAAEDLTAALQLVRSSSLNCYVFEAAEDDSIETKASLLTQKLELSDPCTWRIVLKNTVDLEPPEVQAVAAEKMEALVLSYSLLDSLIDMAREGNADAVPRAQEQIKATMLIASDIEAFVKTTLGV